MIQRGWEGLGNGMTRVTTHNASYDHLVPNLSTCSLPKLTAVAANNKISGVLTIDGYFTVEKTRIGEDGGFMR